MYHSHSLRRTGATLLAIAGRTEEQIKVMGNWTSSAAASRYIDTSEVTMRGNARAIALADSFQCNLVETSESSVVEKCEPELVVVPEKRTEPELPLLPEGIQPLAKKSSMGGVCFTGSIHQVIVVSKMPKVSKP